LVNYKFSRQVNSMKKKIAVIAAIVILAVVMFFASPLASSQTRKPVLTTSAGEGVRPPLAQSIGGENVNWVANEIGAYKLGDGAQIEIAVGGAIYTTSVNGHIPTTSPGSGSPDIRITVSASDFQALYSSGDMISTARQLYDEGKLSIELKRSEITLALKGYKALYDELQN